MQTIVDILPAKFHRIFQTIDFKHANEIRLRTNAPIVVCLSGRNHFLTDRGPRETVRSDAEIIYPTRQDLESILHKASGYSIYSVTEQLRQGFITIRGGIRVGIVGEVVSENGKVSTLKNIHALNIRIPHQIRGCSYPILQYVLGDARAHSTLIISPPGCGKTTMLRDLAWQLSDKYHLQNTLILDERGELAATHLGEPQLDVGPFSDVISGATKKFGFECGIRSMRPDTIITDEVATYEDVEMIKQATRSGVTILASVHAGNIAEIRAKPYFKELVESAVFERYVVLSGLGKVEGVYDRHLRLIAG